jgi:hypothetical protein
VRVAIDIAVDRKLTVTGGDRAPAQARQRPRVGGA